ncbi:hypothetical protein H5410_011015 [Solanum commersonii]|uniref:TIR domain-containing protein n=1 Tax=Solanum commersonii TaxID=4109 RepID=A0A9J6AME3_SOLCO|nr:hypothetical protein H5410_011015 [Solanum commersonii]
MRVEKASVSRPRCSYHVYLSYRGKEISVNFINILHTALTDVGIQTFKRHSEARKGKIVGSELQKAVKESRISIIVFTEDYGYSRRCLDELVNILERKQSAGHMILPVFYRVDPSHIRKREKQIMAKKVERRNEHIAKIKIWRSSLTEVANMAGIVLEDGDELKFIQEIVEDIWGKLSRKVLSFAPYPVGIYSHVKAINFWLQDSSTNSRTLMIYGEPGIGKTTIAKALFNLHCDRFQCSRFLGDIREIAKESCGLINLQKNLLSDLLKEDKIDLNDIDRGASTIKECLVHKKFLLVLDDVDDLNQLKGLLDSRDWIPPGIMALKSFVLIIAILAVVTSISHASDPSPLQDFCVAVNDSMTTVFVNGKVCKDPKVVTADDFFKSGLNVPGNTSNQLGSVVTAVNVNNLPGLNTLGISLARIDFAPHGLNPPHTHPRGTEVLTVLEGTLYVGFVLSTRFNVGKTKAVAFAGLSSQNPGVITIANAVFGSDPPINDDVLAKAFQVDKKVVDYLQSQFWWDNN